MLDGRCSRWLRLTVVAMGTSQFVACGGGLPPELELLSQDAQEVMAFVENPLTDTPSFIRTALSLTTLGLPPVDTTEDVAFAFVTRYLGLFGLQDAQQDLEYLRLLSDTLGMRHMKLKQVFQGIDVYGGEVAVHLGADGSQVQAVTNSVVPDIRVNAVTPAIDQNAALVIARDSLPNGESVSTTLAVYPGRKRSSSARLAWLVELRDATVPARNVYVVDATNGNMLDVLDRLFIARNRRTHNANGGTTLPGALARSEGQGPVSDQDIDRAHDFAGNTYDYFFTTHGRDSYDDAGATLVSTAHYSNNFQNAFWDGVQMVYGDGFPVEDVAAHELTHAVTERTSNLEYRWQSGALNESFSDIFGVMVDRDDWILGEDLPIGPIRDVSNPPAFGDPDHTNNWFETCGDNEGVHTNSGIHNKAFFNVATAIGKDKAELIFYRALSVYLGVTSSMEDARAAALQSAQDIYGTGSAEVSAVNTGFDGVGLDGTFNPPQNNCGGGPAPDVSLWGLLTMVLVALGFLIFRRRGGIRGPDVAV